MQFEIQDAGFWAVGCRVWTFGKQRWLIYVGAPQFVKEL